MVKSSISVTANEALIPDLLEAARGVPDVAASKPVFAESVPSSYRSPIGMSPDDVQALLKVVSLVFSSGTAMITFVDKLLDLIRKHRQPVVIGDPRDPKKQLSVDEGTSADAVRNWIERGR